MSKSLSLRSAGTFTFDDCATFMVRFTAHRSKCSTTTSSDKNIDFSCRHQSILATKPSGEEKADAQKVFVWTRLEANFQYMTSSCGRAIVLVLPTSDWLRKWCEFSRIKKSVVRLKKQTTTMHSLRAVFRWVSETKIRVITTANQKKGKLPLGAMKTQSKTNETCRSAGNAGAKFCIWLVERVAWRIWTNHRAKQRKPSETPHYFRQSIKKCSS